MTPNQLFSIANALALVAWLVLIVPWSQRWMAEVGARWVIPGVFAAMYAVIVGTHWAGSSGGFATLSEVGMLFGEPWLLLAGWVHYLAFDLLVGSWEARDARERGVGRLVLAPCLGLTFLFGPAGWLLYTIVRAVHAAGHADIPGSVTTGAPRSDR